MSSLPPHLRHVQEAIQARNQGWADQDKAFVQAVMEARRAKYSLQEIGDAAGMSAQGVRKAIVRGVAP